MADRDGGAVVGDEHEATKDGAKFTKNDGLALGWIDAIIDARSGALLSLRSEGHDNHGGWLNSFQGPELSERLAAAWCGGGGGCEPGERVRVTFRMATRVRHLVDESFDVLRGGAEAAGGGGGAAARGRPDVFLFEVRR